MRSTHTRIFRVAPTGMGVLLSANVNEPPEVYPCTFRDTAAAGGGRETRKASANAAISPCRRRNILRPSPWTRGGLGGPDVCGATALEEGAVHSEQPHHLVSGRRHPPARKSVDVQDLGQFALRHHRRQSGRNEEVGIPNAHCHPTAAHDRALLRHAA